MVFQKPKGTEDFGTNEMSMRNAIFDSLSATTQSFGFSQVSTPAFETLSLLTKKEGDEIKSQIFTLEKRSNEEFGLRFDLTVPLARMFMEGQKSFTKPVKWYSLDRMWRYEKPQQGRMREFYQLSVELFGASSVLADAEIINVALSCLKNLGLTEKDIVLKLNNRKLLQALLAEMIPKNKFEAAVRIIDKRAKVSKEAFIEMLTEEGITNVSEITTLLDTDVTDIKSDNKAVQDALSDVLKTLELLGENKKYVQFDLSTVRGLAYYTGIVFEVFDCAGKFRAILGGGRYDNMVGLFGGEETPATGFGLGYTTLMLLLKEKGLLPKTDPTVDYYLANVSANETAAVIDLASKLRSQYRVETDLQERGLNAQLKYANKINAKNVIVIGEEEVKSGKYKIKNLSSGKEITKTTKELLS